MVRLAPSILSADFSKLGEEAAAAARGGADLLHIDVMDGHFVPNISYGSAVMKSLLGKTEVPFDVHLMIEEPDRYMEDFMTDMTAYITVHQETCPDLPGTLKRIRAIGAGAGVAINPETPADSIFDVFDQVDMVLIMSVHPGFGGQKFIPDVLKKAVQIAEAREKNGFDFNIEMDGGITAENVKKVISSGVEIVVAGSSVFGSGDIERAVRKFIDIIHGGNRIEDR